MKNRTKTISLLIAVCMMITLLPAMAFAASSEWVEDTGSGMKYRYYDNNFDIHGFFNGTEKQTTYNNYGYKTYVRIGNSDYRVNASPSSEIYTVGETGLQVGIDLSFGGSGQDSYVNIKYTVQNTTNAPVTFSLGSGADVKIGNDDSAVITPMDTCNGFKMVSNNSKDSHLLDNGEREYAQFNFFGSGEGITEIDSYWYGAYSYSYNNHWSLNETTAIFEYGAAECYSDDIDSAATWRWDNETVDAGGTKTYTVAIGIGGKGSEEAVVDEGVIKGTVPYSNVSVKLVRLNGTEYNANVEPAANQDGTYSYTVEAPRGQYYNVVATGSDTSGKTVTVTKLIKLADEEETCNITFPSHGNNSVVVNDADDFFAVAGVDVIADRLSDSNKTVSLKVGAAADENEKEAIREKAGNKLIDFVDLSLLSDNDDIGASNGQLLTILLKYDTSRSGIQAFRYHAGTQGSDPVHPLTKITAAEAETHIDSYHSTTPSLDGEGYFWVGNGYVGIIANKFSTYAIAYDAPANEPPVDDPAPTAPAPKKGIDLWYNGGNSFGSSRSAVPTSVEIDGVEVPFTGNGSQFTVGCISPDAEWVTVRWNSTSVTVNFTPDNVTCVEVAIPKTGDASVMAYALMAVIAAAGAMGKR